MSLYDASRLRDEVALEVAIGDLESNLARTSNVRAIVEDLASVPRLLEFALASVGDTAAGKLSDGILDMVPSDAKSFSASMGARLLQRFSLLLVFLSYPSPADKPEGILDEHRSIERAKQALQIIAQHTFEQNGTTGSVVRGHSSKKQRKKQQSQQSSSQRLTFDSKVFDDLGIEVPSDENEALGVVATIIDSQKRLLKSYLQVLRYSHLREAIKQTYVTIQAGVSDAVASFTTRSDMSTTTQTDGAAEGMASAYPFVQPIKAALYFDSAEGFGEWRILISSGADKDLRQMRKKSPKLFRITLKKIQELSWGHFSPDNHKALTENAEIPVHEAKMTGDSRLVYQIDCVSEYETNVEKQVIRVFGIYTHAQLNRTLWDSIGRELGRRGREYKSRCVFRNRPAQIGQHVGVILPASWPAPAEVVPVASSSALPDFHKDDLDKMQDMLVLEKYVTLSQAFLNSLLADQDVTHVFDVSPQEKQIIEHLGSCYVQGRSGTGKTTTMLFKMLGIERSWQACEGALVKPRQIFVTQSTKLAEKVQEYFARLLESLLIADQSSEASKAARTVKEQLPATDHISQDLVDEDEEMRFRGDLPHRFSDLTDQDFPLFVTFDQLCCLLEAEFPTLKQSMLSQQSVRQTPANLISNEELATDYMQQRRTSFVSYEVFLGSYWAHFPQSWTNGLDPALVFAEIMGVIKGSEQTLNSEHGFLGRDVYLGLSHRTQSTFASQRGAIYDLFLAYLKQKRRRGEWDAADRTHHILNSIQSQGLPGQQLDFLYVDEAQDNLLIDALVLRSMCRNADTGLFWAGDTAQTISIGSAFRFDDLKAFLYHIELSGGSRTDSHRQPHAFQLAINYRSHAGIVNCAHSIIELITTFWPYAIDTLAPERGMIDGAKPVFFIGWDEDTARYEQFLFGDPTAGHLEFGAHQCILVRDEAARNRLRAQVGDIGIIQTIYESKGLEYDDVLLYNFFADSTVELAQWRVILNALSGDEYAAQKAPQFDDSRHHGVCRELKFLYVAITRARKNVWIADHSDKCEPMRHVWDAKGLIRLCTSLSGVPHLATSSTPQEWAKAARTLFENKQYMQAMLCYERAKLPRDHAMAQAYYLREKARTTPAYSRGYTAARVAAYRKAAEAFWELGHEATSRRLSYFRISAECFFPEGNNLPRAAEAYILAEQYNMSANLYRSAGKFDKAIAIVKKHKGSMEPSVVTTIMDVSRLEYLRKRKIGQARTLFDSDDDALEYMDVNGLDAAKAMFLEQLGRLADAAQVHLDEGRATEAISLLLRDRSSVDATVRASHHLLDGLRRRVSFGVRPSSDVAKSDPIFQDLCRILDSQTLQMAYLDDNIRDELLMFRAIIKNDVLGLRRLSEQFRQRHKDTTSALRCLDYAFLVLPKLQVASLAEIADNLHHFNIYVELLCSFSFSANLSADKGIENLFAFKAATDDFFLIPKDTFLFPRCPRHWSQGTRQSDQGVLLLKHELNGLLQQVLQDRLRTKLREENRLCRRLRAFQVCLPFFAFGKCMRAGCPQDHVAFNDYGVDSYNLRVRVHLQQILIYNSARVVEIPHEQAQERQYWLHQLHDTLNPSFFKLGTVHSLRPLIIPEYNDAIQVVKGWVLHSLYDLNPYGEREDVTKTFLTELTRSISLGLTSNSAELRYHLNRIQSVAICRPRALLRGKGGADQAYVIQDLGRYVYNEHPASLASGILFLKHILENRLTVDIVALCDFLDVLAGRLIVASRLNSANTLHDLTMPRSWLQRVLPDLPQLQNKNTNLVGLYMAPMAGLLEQIYNADNTAHLLFEGSNLSKLGWHVRNVFLARICRNLCLLGYNSRYTWLRNTVYSSITSLTRDRPGREFNRIYQHYVYARSWGGLANEVREYSTSGSPFDEMVQLYHAQRGQPQHPPFRNVRRIVYNDASEIPVLLAPGTNTRILNGLRVGAAPFVTQQAQMYSESRADEPPAAAVEYDQEAEEEEDVNAAPPVVNLSDESFAFEAPDPAAAQLAQEKLKVAKVLVDAYRRRARRKKDKRSTTPATVIQLRFANAYRAACRWDETMERPQKRYHVRVLVPLPYGMAFLELARAHLHGTKGRLKKRILSVEHLELEKVKSEMTQCNEQLKEAIRLIKALEPGAGMHERRDMEELKARVREVEQFAESLPPRVTTEWDFYLKTAVDGILKPRPRPAKKPKPEPNMADDDMMDYDDDEWSDGE